MSRSLKQIDWSVVEAVTLDFYNTLVFHNQGSTRAATLLDYLSVQGLASDPWEHQVLYDVFERHADDYSPDFTAEEKRRYLVEFAGCVFRRLNVCAAEILAAEHAEAIWRILGPSCLGVFPEVHGVLRDLAENGYPLALVSNWQSGLGHFCQELDLEDNFQHIVVSAEYGKSKPDPEIFHEASRRLRVPCSKILHVGDSVVDDFEGAKGAGMQAILVQRYEGGEQDVGIPMIRSLDRLTEILHMNGKEGGL